MLHCAITDTFMNTVPLWNTDKLYNYRYIHEHCCKGAECVGIDPMFLLVDSSDSPSVVEQLQQGHDAGCYTLLAVIPSSMRCLMPYACQLAFCSMGISYYAPCSCSYGLMFPMSFSFFFSSTFYTLATSTSLLFSPLFPFLSLSLLLSLGLCSPSFIQVIFSLNPGIACLTMCTLG